MKILVSKVEKLDKLDGLVVRVANLTKSVEFVHETVNTIKQENVGMKEDIKRIKEENFYLVDLQARNMRDNLLFFNIPETDGENTELLIKELIKEELKIAEDIEFARVHRIGRKAPHKIRPILANNKKRSHTQLDPRKQVTAFQDRVITINIKEAQHPLK